MDYSSNEAHKASVQVAESELRIRVGDVRFVLETLEMFDRSDPNALFQGHVDTALAGVFGYSFGGAVAAEACRLDERFRAGIDMDGRLFGKSASDGVEQPFLFMSSDVPFPTDSELANSTGAKHRSLAMLQEDDRNIRRSLKRHGGYFLKINGASHANFCDTPLFLPIRRLSGAGPIEAKQAIKVINDFTVSFFDHHLNGSSVSRLFGRNREYAEAEVETWDHPVPVARQMDKASNPASRNK